MSRPSLVIHGTAFHTPQWGELEVLENCAIAVNASGTIESVLHPGDAQHQTLISDAGNRQILHQLEQDEYLIPGLVDLHIHAPQWPQLGKALDVPLEVWLQEYTFPLEARYSDHVFAHQIYDDLVQTLLSHGTTTAVYFGSVDLQANIILAQSCLRHGQRALVGKVAMDNHDQCPDYYRDHSATTALNDTKTFINAVRTLQANESKLVLPVITPRFIPSCTDELLYGLGQLALDCECHIQTHCSESDWEVAYVRNRLNKSDTEALSDYGLLSNKTILAHCNFVNTSDLKLMAKKGAAVAHCPLSNAYFANAVFPARHAHECGVTIGLGTDISGGFSPSVFDATRFAIMASRLASSGTSPTLQADDRGSEDAPLSTIETFHMATAQGGEALRLPIGQFKPGYTLDALCIRANEPSSAFRIHKDTDSLQDVFEKLVLTADKTCISEIWVDGKDAIKRRHTAHS